MHQRILSHQSEPQSLKIQLMISNVPMMVTLGIQKIATNFTGIWFCTFSSNHYISLLFISFLESKVCPWNCSSRLLSWRPLLEHRLLFLASFKLISYVDETLFYSNWTMWLAWRNHLSIWSQQSWNKDNWPTNLCLFSKKFYKDLFFLIKK